MTTDSRTFAPNVVLGFGIAGVGVALLLDRLGLVEARTLLQYWPALLVLFGGSIVWQAIRGGAEPGHRPIVSPGLVILLVIAGVVASRGDFRRSNQTGRTTSETVSVNAVLGGSRQTSVASTFRRADMSSVMGGSVLDLRQTTIPEGEEAVIDVFALMGGVDIFVPRHWVVVTEAVAVMGGVDDRRARTATRPASTDGEAERDRDDDAKPTTTDDTVANAAPVEAAQPAAAPEQTTNPPRLVIRGLIIMGGLNIRS